MCSNIIALYEGLKCVQYVHVCEVDIKGNLVTTTKSKHFQRVILDESIIIYPALP